MAHQLPTDLLNNSQGILYNLSKWAYNVTLGWFWALVLLGLCAVIGISTVRYGTPRSYGFSSFVGMVGATMLAIMQLLSWGIASMFIVAGFIGFVVMILNER